MWSESDMLDSISRSSRVDTESWESAIMGCGEEWGSSSRVDAMRGSKVSMVSRSGIIARGPEKEEDKEVNVRDWCVRCVVRASCAVFSLE
jgi:hypothetical protein